MIAHAIDGAAEQEILPTVFALIYSSTRTCDKTVQRVGSILALTLIIPNYPLYTYCIFHHISQFSARKKAGTVSYDGAWSGGALWHELCGSFIARWSTGRSVPN